MYPTYEEISVQLNEVKEKYESVPKQTVEDIFFAILCNAYKYGKREISVQEQEIENYLPNLEFLLCDCCHMNSVLFEKREDSYVPYLTFLKDKICQNGLGKYQRGTASIVLQMDPYYMERVLKSMVEVQDIICVGTELLLQEVPTYYLKKQVGLTLHKN